MSKLTKWKKSFDNLRKGWMIKEDRGAETPIVFLPEPMGGILDDDGHNKHNKRSAGIIEVAPEALATLRLIYNYSENEGREGCTYGDTDYDSVSVVYGYNLALENIKGDIEKLIDKAKDL